MGLFGGGKKKTCAFCGGKAGFLSSTTLTDGERICSNCEEGLSPFLQTSDFDSAAIPGLNESYGRVRAFLQEIAADPDAITFPRWDRYPVARAALLTIHPNIGMFTLRDAYAPRGEGELFRFDQLTGYRPSTAPSLLQSSDDHTMSKAGFRIELGSHPYLSGAEVKFASRVPEQYVQDVVTAVNDIASRFDRLLGIPEVAGLVTSVAGVFGVRTDVAREVIPATASKLAELTRLADEAEQRWGQIW